MMLVCPPRGILLIGRAAPKPVLNPNPFDHQHAVLQLDVALDRRLQSALAGLDPARLQRAS
jgi:hypothetical protein